MCWNANIYIFTHSVHSNLSDVHLSFENSSFLCVLETFAVVKVINSFCNEKWYTVRCLSSACSFFHSKLYSAYCRIIYDSSTKVVTFFLFSFIHHQGDIQSLYTHANVSTSKITIISTGCFTNKNPFH